MRKYQQNVLIQGRFIGRRIAKAWLMKPKAKAGHNACDAAVAAEKEAKRREEQWALRAHAAEQKVADLRAVNSEVFDALTKAPGSVVDIATVDLAHAVTQLIKDLATERECRLKNDMELRRADAAIGRLHAHLAVLGEVCAADCPYHWPHRKDPP